MLNLKNIYYLSGFWGTAGTILVTQKAQYLLTDSRYSVAVREVAVDFDIVETREAFVEIAKLLKKETVYSSNASVSGSISTRRCPTIRGLIWKITSAC